MEALKSDSRSLALAVHAALGHLDPARMRADMRAAMSERLSELSARASAVRDAAAAHHAGLTERLHEVAEVLRERSDLSDVRARLHEAYDQLGSELAALDVHVPTVRPSNHARSVYHMLSSTAVVVFVVIAPASWLLPVALSFAGAAWSLETVRRLFPGINGVIMRIFGPVAHPHEHQRINSGTWYVSGLAILAFIAEPWSCAVSVAVLGWGDPVAALVGRRWGRRRLLHGRTMEGTAAFIVAGALATGVTLALGYPGVPRIGGICLGAGLAGAAAELVSGRLDDNFTIPLATAACTALIAAL